MDTSQSKTYEAHKKLNTLIIKEMQITITMRYHFLSNVMERMTILSIGKNEDST